MGVDELYLCPFCADLVEKRPVSSASTAVAHHSTYGALVASSEHCTLCACLCSLLPGSSQSLFEEEARTKQLFLVELVEHGGQLSPGVSWREYDAGVKSLVAPTAVKATFTLAVCPPQGEDLRPFVACASAVPAGYSLGEWTG
jgi:hypothetical protein